MTAVEEPEAVDVHSLDCAVWASDAACDCGALEVQP